MLCNSEMIRQRAALGFQPTILYLVSLIYMFVFAETASLLYLAESVCLSKWRQKLCFEEALHLLHGNILPQQIKGRKLFSFCTSPFVLLIPSMTRTRPTSNSIEDVILRAEMLAPTALELEESRRIKQEEMVRDYDLWNDPAKSNEILVKLADSVKVVDALKDLKYKAEEAKLIAQLAEIDAVNYSLFEQAYDASLAINDLLDKYEVSKLLRGPYEMEGACVIIKAGSEGNKSEEWAEQLLGMYIKWGGKQGYRGRVVEKNLSTNGGGIKSATIEFEFDYAYGFLSGERGIHCMIRSSQNGSVHNEVSSVGVDVVPLFLGTTPDLQIGDDDLILSSTLSAGEKHGRRGYTVCVQHIPTALTFQSSGERSYFANQIKALNRLKAKLLVVTNEQGVSSVSSIKGGASVDIWQKETRRYMFHPGKLVRDVKTGLELPDLNSVLDGNIEPFIAAYINTRQSNFTF
ncbi:peptide chain release factor PrfB3, chloroplastic-like isoform X2 [Hibiscus syriacus]|uniref:peptide chain release factor PrfB3, chloroplastic-like isoform X2 n=1 Tax=Hibiscus syriacus TaxID=106335 RepID=UPI0019248B8D|nr:peptide chain release factor PrfB3, chloroplastic-like isoform X2 [Hibiscus syriacus]